ncbi:hypothetical protein [Streptomyces sp. NPDC001435]|uniref:hypothetical protein n=1 Tax=Streptomyces sp. NPDC001435 TaxID=3364576 RepID=UPI00368D6968
MNQRKDTYRAALQRGPYPAASRPAKVTHLHTRYVRVTIELDPKLPGDLNRWVGTPVSALAHAGESVLRPMTSWCVAAGTTATVEASSLVAGIARLWRSR